MTILHAILVGAGATLVIDLWAMLLQRALGVKSLNLCLLGRWALHLLDGTFRHPSISAAATKPHECKAGWVAHYSIGAGFAVLFALGARGWLQHPTLLPALAFGLATVVVPFTTVQPGMGLGFASSKAPSPWKARLKSTVTHAVFGAGLFLSAFLLNLPY